MRLSSVFEFYLRRWTWKTYLFIWTWLSLLIICSDGVDGQDKQLMLLTQDILNPTLTTSAPELNDPLGSGNDILRIKTEEYFPKKLEKSFQKHRWKINKDFSISPLEHNGETTTIPLVTSQISGNVTHHPSPALLDAADEDENNVGQEETDEEDPEILHLMTTAALEDIPRISNNKMTFENHTTTEMPFELISHPDLVRNNLMESKKILKTGNEMDFRNGQAPTKKSSEEEKMRHADIELFKIKSVESSSSNNSSKNRIVKFRPNSAIDEKDKTNSNSNESERLIPQLVNVTTEDVYISMESDETMEDSLMNPNSQDLSSTTNDPPVITVNASGIFPQTNLSSIWDRSHKSRKHSLLSSFPDSSSQDERDGDESNASEFEESEEDEEEDGKQEKTMMMKRRPRRSVVHLYDMVVCATGCNPLIYKGYGCFCGFMGSGITVDGIDKCCYKHDWCYHHAKCPPLLTYFVPYYWTCNSGHPKCVSDFRGWKGICGAHLCECDRQFAECLRKYPCPRSRAMCMTSPWRFWQNIVMQPPYYG